MEADAKDLSQRGRFPSSLFRLDWARRAPTHSGSVESVIREVIQRRAKGEQVDDHAILRAHPELSAELEPRLRDLRHVEHAEELARAAGLDLSPSLRVETRAQPAFPPWIGGMLPGYDGLEELGRGGQGVVYRARQRSTQRIVAIKFLRGGPFLREREKAYFESEVRTLARLKHPNIVTILDSGSTSGFHYLVMDFVSGEPVDRYVATTRLGVSETLRLFAKVSHAIHAAHLKGVIHRDLKPSHVCVSAAGEPFLLDFGLARRFATDDPLETSIGPPMTQTGHFVGSIPWCSPEQAEGHPDAIDLRTDVYSLGAILFHVLTGAYPYDIVGGLHHVLRNVIESEPPRPSSLRATLDADIDAILLKCLAKQPAMRYPTALTLAEDIERYLRNEPIVARSPSTMYRVRKLVRKHKIPAALLLALVLAISGFSVWMTILYGVTRTQRNRAVDAEQLAETRRSEAEREATTAKAVTDFLVNDVLAAASPGAARGRTLTVAEAFQNAAQRMNASFTHDPLLRATVLTRVGEVYCGLGLYGEAIAPLREASELREVHLGGLHAATLESKRVWLDALLQSGAYAEAEPIAWGLHGAMTAALGADHLETLQVAARVAQLDWFQGRVSQAITLFSSTYRELVQRVGEDHPASLYVLSQPIATEFLDSQGLDECERLLRRGLAASRERHGDDAPETLRLMTSLGITLMRERQFSAADELLQRSVHESRRVLGVAHLDTIVATTYQAALQQQQRLLREAEATCRCASELAIRQFGESHWQTIWILDRLADIHTTRDNHGDALQLHRILLERKQRIRDPGDLSIAHSWSSIGTVLHRLGRFDEAAAAHLRGLDIAGSTARPSLRVGILRGLVRSMGAAGRGQDARPYTLELLELRHAQAESTLRDAYAISAYGAEMVRAEPPELRNPVGALRAAMRAFEMTTDEFSYNRYVVGLCHEALGDLDAAAQWMRRGLESTSLQRNIFRQEQESALVRVLNAMGDREGAEEVYRITLAARRQTDPVDEADVAESLDDLGRLFIEYGKFDDAETALREALELRRRALDPADFRIGFTMSSLGEAAFRQGRHAEAEELLVRGLEGMPQDESTSYTDLQTALSRLVAFYQATGDPRRADEYERRLLGVRSIVFGPSSAVP